MTPTAAILDTAPAEAFGPASRLAPIRKPEGFTPAVQRWSAKLPGRVLRVAFFGAQAPDAAGIAASGFHGWVEAALVRHPHRPSVHDHAIHRDGAGLLNHVAAAYWVDDDAFAAWSADAAVQGWWSEPARLHGPAGAWREVMHMPPERQETIYWIDYPAGLMRSPAVSIFPTPYCGYYGAMRDRLLAAATDPLDAAPGAVLQPVARTGFGQRWRVRPPGNLAVIRSANTWGRMDGDQRADYEQKLRGPLDRGMDYLRTNAVPAGCASLRMQTTTDAAGNEAAEQHALGYFLSLRHMEDWAEGHQTHAAIFGAAISRYKRYGAANQLRTWHEVFVLPDGDQLFEYANCHPGTGLLSWFDAEQVA